MGVNVPVVSLLKDRVQEMSDNVRVCYAMFDEMSMREYLHFNQKSECIEGFGDFGSHDRTSNIVNHALFCMLHGLHKRWKQPVTYYLICGSTNGEMFLIFLMENLDACHNARLIVVAAVCDMGTNNVKALKQVRVSEKTTFFRFRDQQLQECFILFPCLNAHLNFSLNTK